MLNTCLAPCAQHPSASALLQRKASTQRRAAVTPSRFLFDVCEARSWGTPQHGSADTAWISPSFTPLPFPTHIFNSFRLFSFHELHCFCSPSCPGFLDLWKASIWKAKSSQQSVPNTQLRIPTHRSFQSPGQDRSWQVRVGWCSLHVAQGTKRTLSCASVWVLETRERHRFLWQSVSHPNHGSTFLLFPSALHSAPHQIPTNGTWQGVLSWQQGSESPGWESLQTHWKSWGSVFLQHSAAGTGTLWCVGGCKIQKISN